MSLPDRPVMEGATLKSSVQRPADPLLQERLSSLVWRERLAIGGDEPAEEASGSIGSQERPYQATPSARSSSRGETEVDLQKTIDVSRLADQVYRVIEQRVRAEREWRGVR